MARFMLVRSADPEEISCHVNLSCKICARERRAKWVRCCYSFEQGRVFCEWEAPDRETLQMILTEFGLASEDIIKVQSMTPEECDWKVFGDLED